MAFSEDDYPDFDPDCTYAEYGYYHGYTKMDKEGTLVLYPFGYGLSYTTFEVGAPSVEVFDETAKIRVNVKNTGTRDSFIRLRITGVLGKRNTEDQLVPDPSLDPAMIQMEFNTE